MTDDEKKQILSDEIYSKCSISIRNCDSQAVASKLIELGYEKKTETAESIFKTLIFWAESQRTWGEAISINEIIEFLQNQAAGHGVEVKV